MNKNRLDTE